MILVDSNVLMYAAGRPHPHKKASVTFLRAVARGDIEATVDAEVLQEVLHRYHYYEQLASIPWDENGDVEPPHRKLKAEATPVKEKAS